MAEAILNHFGNAASSRIARAVNLPATVRPEALDQLVAAGHLHRRSSQQIVGRVRRSRCPPHGLHLHCLRQRRQRACPFWPGHPMTAHWGVTDPAAAKGTREQIARQFQNAFSILDRRISLFLSLPLASLETLAVQRAIDAIGQQGCTQRPHASANSSRSGKTATCSP